MIVQLSGHSDDIICVRTDIEGKIQDDEITANVDAGTTVIIRSIGGRRTAEIQVFYDGCWSFMPVMAGEGFMLPPGWTFTIDNQPQHLYSLRLTVDTGNELVEVEKAA